MINIKFMNNVQLLLELWPLLVFNFLFFLIFLGRPNLNSYEWSNIHCYLHILHIGKLIYLAHIFCTIQGDKKVDLSGLRLNISFKYFVDLPTRHYCPNNISSWSDFLLDGYVVQAGTKIRSGLTGAWHQINQKYVCRSKLQFPHTKGRSTLRVSNYFWLLIIVFLMTDTQRSLTKSLVISRLSVPGLLCPRRVMRGRRPGPDNARTSHTARLARGSPGSHRDRESESFYHPVMFVVNFLCVSSYSECYASTEAIIRVCLMLSVRLLRTNLNYKRLCDTDLNI